jgi:hypothetical protein
MTFSLLVAVLHTFRRYALSATLGLVTDKDTDAGGEQVKVEKHEPKKTKIDAHVFLKLLKQLRTVNMN